MTMPSEEVRALKMGHETLRYLLTAPRMTLKELRARAYAPLRHYPGDHTIDEKWSDEVCEHGTDRQFCRICEEVDDEKKQG